MAITQNTYTGNGSTVLYSFAFPYLNTADVKVSLNGTITTAYTFANATTIQFNTAPANGAAIRIYRETNDASLQAVLSPGSSIRASDLNDNFDQLIYLGQEANTEADSATATANTALTNSATAISTANTASTNASAAVSTANTASANASAAVTTANTASTNASNAVSTANTASTNATTALNTANSATTTANNATSTANTALSTANTALTNANAAVSTANTASTNANNAVSTANTASTNATNAVNTANTASTNATTAVNTANSAVTTANAAAAAVANAVLYTTVANVAAIPGSPANNAAVEVTNSTGIESFTPLSGLPAGFVGSSGLSVRIIYQTAGATWTWIQYFPNDPEARYLKFSGGTLTGQLRGDDSASTSTPGFAFDGDANTGMGRPGADELALITGGTARLTIDPAGAVSIPGTLGVTGAVTGTSTVSGSALIPTGSSVPTNGVYLPAANTVGISTSGTQRLLIGSSGTISAGGGISGAGGLNVSGGGWGVLPYVANSLVIDSTAGQTRLFATGTDASTHGNLLFFTGTTNGTASERMRLTSTGLGVGTSSPSELFNVATSSVSDTTLIRLDGGAGIRQRFFPSGGTGKFNWQIAAQTNVDNGFEITPSSASGGSTFSTPAVVVKSNGNVGIGTSSPVEALTVNGRVQCQWNAFVNGGTTSYSGDAASLVTGSTAGMWAARSDSALLFSIGSSEKVRIDSSGRLGIGTASVGTTLHVKGGNGNQVYVDNDGSQYSGIEVRNNGVDKATVQYDNTNSTFKVGTRSAASVQFLTSDVERGRFDTNGNLCIGASSFVNGPKLGVRGNTNLASSQAVVPSSSCGLVISSTSGGSADNGGALWFDHGDLFSGIAGSRVSTGTWGTDLRFYTHPDSTTNQYTLPERMRISQAGELIINSTTRDTSVGGDCKLQVLGTAGEWTAHIRNNSSTPYGLRIAYNTDANNTGNQFLVCDGGGTNRAVIRSNGGLANYQANNVNLSDINTKKDISPAAGTWDCIKEWEIVNYRYKDQPDDVDLNLGVIAQQVAETCPEVITVFEEAKDDQPEKLGIKEQQMYWMAIKALQEAQVRIEQLEAKVAALEAQ